MFSDGVISDYHVFPKESSTLEHLQRQLSTATLSRKPFCPIKWTVHATPIIHFNYTVLCETLLYIPPFMMNTAEKWEVSSTKGE